MNYKDYLLEQLNIVKGTLSEDDDNFKNFEIIVTEERSFKLPKEKNTKQVLLFLVKKLTGSFTLNIKTQPFQIICYTELDSFNYAQQVLDYFILTHKNGSNESVFYEGTTLFKQDYDTAVALRPMIQTDTGFKASFYCFGTYVECANLSDVQNIVYHYGINLTEEVNYVSTQVSYAVVPNTAKTSGEEISYSLKQEAGLSISMVLMNDNSQFVKDINQIMLGKKVGNTRLELSFTLNGYDFVYSFLLVEASFTTDRKNAPGLNITLTR